MAGRASAPDDSRNPDKESRMSQSFRIYPKTRIQSCKKCPFRSETECTFTDGPAFDDKPPSYVHRDCPKLEEKK